MTDPRDIPDEAVEAAARAGHLAYEDLAPAIGYSTRVRTRVPWDELAHDMQILMLHAYRAGIAAALPFLSAGRWMNEYGVADSQRRVAEDERDAALARAEQAEDRARELHFDARVALPEAQERFQHAEARADKLAEALRQSRTAIRDALDLMSTMTDDELGPGGGARRAYAGLYGAYWGAPKVAWAALADTTPEARGTTEGEQ